jgi:tetratricopeptide (TPR) repeat protein
VKFAVTTLLLLLFAIFLDADVIYLKNGKKIECTEAKEEGDAIKYTIANGTVSIRKSTVARIERTQAPVEADAPDTGVPKGRIVPDAQTSQRLARFYTDRGMEFVNKKDYQSAVEHFQKAHEYHKNEVTSLNLAIAYYLLKDDWNAEANFREALKRNPDNTVALNYMAEMHWRKEELDDARTYWKRSLEVKDNEEIRQKLLKLDREQNASANYDSTVSSHFLIRYDGGQGVASLTSEISAYLEDAYRILSAQFDLHPAEPFVVILYPRQQYFNVMDVPMWSAGANDGKIKLPIKGLTSLNDELKTVLIHELSHSFVDLKTLKNSPVWLQEGLAKYAEGERLGAQGKNFLKNMIASGSLPRFQRLQGSFGGFNAQTASVLYLQSLSFVEYLIDRNRLYQMNQFLDRLGKQETLSEAFEGVYLVSLEDMEDRWRTDLTLE